MKVAVKTQKQECIRNEDWDLVHQTLSANHPGIDSRLSLFQFLFIPGRSIRYSADIVF